jgi:hypothetical protein
MSRSKALKRVIDGINVCIDFSSGLPSHDEYGDPANRLIYLSELLLAREYLNKIADDPNTRSEEKILYISSLIKSCARDMRLMGFKLRAEETSGIGDELVETFAAEVPENVSA